ncbi:hypothetical protein [Streptomyces sp. L2]|uniref:hypothetical protein n=1 Tax=Streptomyces sp. L2 TaxID=2162665 RepID=UPI001013047B|nr:hypothetical protein [Streptomyces sp. L2]
MLSHSCEQGVLVVTVGEDTDAKDAAPALYGQISALVHAHRPGSVVIVLDEGAATDRAVGTVLRVHRMCSDLGLLTSVATHSAPARRLLEANADTACTRLVIHARTDTAIATANRAAPCITVPAA